MPVVGMGGYFFRAREPETLKAWYREHLEVGGGMGTDAKGEPNAYLWYPEGGPMVFEPFKESSDYFPADRTAMINLRVGDLKGMLQRLRGAGIEITQEQTHEGVGSFARIHDPEGNPIELWEPPAG
jgi:predicted enzyme related to lactoylglutathione lyase